MVISMANKPIVFIGSTVVDVLMNIPHLPNSSEDINVQSQSLSLGGCAFNASWMCHLLGVDYLLFSPIGTGVYADYIRKEMHNLHLAPSILQSEEENGCCYCLIEENGERSFLSYHGAEYKFKKEWFALLDQQDVDTVYVCGLELEEESGIYILEYLERNPHVTIYFACGPRIQHIPKTNMKRIMKCHPILHLNEEEALQYTSCSTLLEALQELYKQNQSLIIVTLGRNGCAYFDGHTYTHIPIDEVYAIDTTGAGDCHIGSYIAYRTMHTTIEEALTKSNHIAKAIVSKKGAILSTTEFEHLKSESK